MLRYTGPINRALVEQGVKRTSNLLAPIMLLEGHDGEIYCGKEAFIIFKRLGKFYQSCFQKKKWKKINAKKFSNDGKSFISSGFDRHINYWEVFGECLNYHQISHAHKVLITVLTDRTDYGILQNT